MKTKLLVLLVILIVPVLFLGCGDDDECATCPEPAQKAMAVGFTATSNSSNEAYFASYVFGIDGKLVAMDSIMYDDEKTELREGYFELGAVVYAAYEESPTTYDSGDTVEVKFFLPTGSGTAQVKLLDSEFDDPTVISHSTTYPYDTVAIGEELTVAWRSAANADYYYVNWNYRYDSSGTNVYVVESFFTTDNDFDIPASTLSYNGRVDVSIYAISGPRLDIEAGNVTGPVIKGNISSLVSDYTDIIVGTGSSKAPPRNEPETPREMIESFMDIMDQ